MAEPILRDVSERSVKTVRYGMTWNTDRLLKGRLITPMKRFNWSFTFQRLQIQKYAAYRCLWWRFIPVNSSYLPSALQSEVFCQGGVDISHRRQSCQRSLMWLLSTNSFGFPAKKRPIFHLLAFWGKFWSWTMSHFGWYPTHGFNKCWKFFYIPWIGWMFIFSNCTLIEDAWKCLFWTVPAKVNWGQKKTWFDSWGRNVLICFPISVEVDMWIRTRIYFF